MILNRPITASGNPVTTVNAVYPIAKQGDSGMEVICFAKRKLGIVPASDHYCLLWLLGSGVGSWLVVYLSMERSMKRRFPQWVGTPKGEDGPRRAVKGSVRL